MNRAERRAAARRRSRGLVDLAVTVSFDPITGRTVTTTERVTPGQDPRGAFERNMATADAHFDEWATS
jgi:hypothetical protein